MNEQKGNRVSFFFQKVMVYQKKKKSNIFSCIVVICGKCFCVIQLLFKLDMVGMFRKSYFVLCEFDLVENIYLYLVFILNSYFFVFSKIDLI